MSKLFTQYANRKGSDQLVYQRSLISTYVAGCLYSTLAEFEISRLQRYNWAG